MSAAPSISTPFLPPSLKDLATTLSDSPEASAKSFFGKSCGEWRQGGEGGQEEHRAACEVLGMCEICPRAHGRRGCGRGAGAGGDGEMGRGWGRG